MPKDTYLRRALAEEGVTTADCAEIQEFFYSGVNSVFRLFEDGRIGIGELIFEVTKNIGKGRDAFKDAKNADDEIRVLGAEKFIEALKLDNPELLELPMKFFKIENLAERWVKWTGDGIELVFDTIEAIKD